MIRVPWGWRLAAENWGDAHERRALARKGRVVAVLIWNDAAQDGEVLIDPETYVVPRTGVVVSLVGVLSDAMGLLARELADQLRAKSKG